MSVQTFGLVTGAALAFLGGLRFTFWGHDAWVSVKSDFSLAWATATCLSQV